MCKLTLTPKVGFTTGSWWFLEGCIYIYIYTHAASPTQVVGIFEYRWFVLCSSAQLYSLQVPSVIFIHVTWFSISLLCCVWSYNTEACYLKWFTCVSVLATCPPNLMHSAIVISIIFLVSVSIISHRFAVASSRYSSVKKLIDSICIGLMTD